MIHAPDIFLVRYAVEWVIFKENRTKWAIMPSCSGKKNPAFWPSSIPGSYFVRPLTTCIKKPKKITAKRNSNKGVTATQNRIVSMPLVQA